MSSISSRDLILTLTTAAEHNLRNVEEIECEGYTKLKLFFETQEDVTKFLTDRFGEAPEEEHRGNWVEITF